MRQLVHQLQLHVPYGRRLRLLNPDAKRNWGRSVNVNWGKNVTAKRLLMFSALISAIALGCGVGPAGPPGPPGPQGPPGESGQIAGGRHCSKISGAFLFTYNTVAYSSGDKFVYCEIADDLISASSTALYRADQAGAKVDGCALTFDSDTTVSVSGGWWQFTDDQGPRAKYNDSGSALDQKVEVFSSCSVF